MTAQDQPDAASGSEWQIRADIPHPARVYDYWLGGKDNFEIDRVSAVDALKVIPEMLDYARGNRGFLDRATRLLTGAGIRQFLDIGSGFLTSPAVHEIAKDKDPEALIVYVDNDPVVFLHAEAELAKVPGTGVVRADYRDAEAVLSEVAKTLDFTKPVALMFVASLHHIGDEDDPAGLVARYTERLSPGSYLVLSHFTDEFNPPRAAAGHADATRMGITFVPRSRAGILRMFNGLPLLEPGLELVTRWRPDADPGPNADRAWALGGVAAI